MAPVKKKSSKSAPAKKPAAKKPVAVKEKPAAKKPVAVKKEKICAECHGKALCQCGETNVCAKCDGGEDDVELTTCGKENCDNLICDACDAGDCDNCGTVCADHRIICIEDDIPHDSFMMQCDEARGQKLCQDCLDDDGWFMAI